jgi:glutamate racemase
VRAEVADLGIFDGGLGGLTVVAGLARRNPALDIVYFGDSAHMPFSVRGDTWIRQRTQQICDLLGSQCRELVIGCNTMSTIAEALTACQAIHTIIEPTLRWMQSMMTADTLVIVGTPTTVHSGAYERGIRTRDIIRVPCAMLATTIERYGAESAEVRQCIEAEIANVLPMRDSGRVAVLLACTHYPLVRSLIENEVCYRLRPTTLQVVDPSAIIACSLAPFLSAKGTGAIRLLINNQDTVSARNAVQEFLDFGGIKASTVRFCTLDASDARPMQSLIS